MYLYYLTQKGCVDAQDTKKINEPISSHYEDAFGFTKRDGIDSTPINFLPSRLQRNVLQDSELSWHAAGKGTLHWKDEQSSFQCQVTAKSLTQFFSQLDLHFRSRSQCRVGRRKVAYCQSPYVIRYICRRIYYTQLLCLKKFTIVGNICR